MWEQVAGNTGGTVGGLAATEVHAENGVYAATSVGVYRSLDGGRTWALSGVHNTVPFAEALVPSARFEQDRTMFLCAGDGLYRSANAGESWQPVLVGGRMLSVASARIDTGDGLVLLAGTEADGVLRSEDRGRTWTGANAGLLDLTALAIGLSPQFASDRLGFAGTGSGLYRTRNGARSWREVDTGLDEPAVQCLAVSPRFAEDRLVLAGTEAEGLLRSDDGGATWHRPVPLVDEGVTAVAFSRRTPSKIAAATEAGTVVSNDGGHSWHRAGSPPGIILSLSFVPTAEGEVLLAGLHRNGVARSEDEGATWRLSNDGLSARLLTGLRLSPSFARNATLFASGPQDGVSVSLDGGRTWTERNVGLDDTAVAGLAIAARSPDNYTLFAATPAGVHVSQDDSVTWTPSLVAPAPALTVATQPVQTTAGPPTVLAATSGGDVLASEDGAHTWRRLARVAEGADVLVVALSPDYARDRTIFVATQQAAEVVVWRSIDAGQRWSRWLVDHEVGAASQRFVAMAVSPGYASDELLFVSLGGRVFTPVRHAREVRAGQRRPVWRGVDLGGGAVAVTAIAPSPSFVRDGTLFAATNAGVFVSRDRGASYHVWNEGLTSSGVVALAVSPAYAADALVYVLGLGGTIWRRRDRDAVT